MYPKRNEEGHKKISGFFLIDKKIGITSHDVVEIFRNKLGIKRIGHTGTLDPSASGLLIILVGNYTSKQQEFQKMEKIYEGKIRFGIVTDTWDMEGKVVRETKDINIRKSDLEKVISFFDGTISQKVPPYSAVKYKGNTLYKLARKNISIPVIKKTVRVKWLWWHYSDSFLDFKIKCSSGTYVRSIAYEMGEILGCGGVLWTLRRLAIGDYSIENAINIDEIQRMNKNEILKFLKR